MRTLNLGILAHVDAGKTTLTERLLYAAGVIDEIGSVDDGSTQTDTLALERQRGITIRSAVVSFVVGDVAVNLIDTPGHPDFIAEVERVLTVLDGAVLVVSAVEGVQPQTRVLMRTLRRLRIPTLVFVNKIDRAGADGGRVLREIRDRLGVAAIPMGSPAGEGSRAARVTPYGAGDAGFTDRLVDLVTEHDDAVLAAYVADERAVSYRHLRAQLAALTARTLVHPVFFGSAVTGAGVDALIAASTELLPAGQGACRNGLQPALPAEDGAGGPVAGSVFKVERGPAGEKIAYVRMFSGTVRVRDRLRLRGRDNKVTAMRVFDRGSALPGDSVAAGRIAKIWGLADVRVGDRIGAAGPVAATGHHFAPPTLETVVVPRRPADRGALHTALSQLAEQDPLINLRQDDARQEVSVSLYGEVQKEVVQATLAADFGLAVTFRETTTICVERPAGTGASAESMNDAGNPFRATVGLRVQPGAVGSGVEFRLEVELGSMPYAFFKAVEETVRETLRQGLHGWEVTDCVVTMTHSGFTPPPPYGWSTSSSSAGDFRGLTPLVLMSALRQAGTRVYEPVHRFRLELPAEVVGSVLPALAKLRAIPQPLEVRGTSCVLEGVIAADRVHGLRQLLPGLTRGEGVLESTFDHYEVVRGEVPSRPRSDHNPLDRAEYLLHVTRRVGGTA